MYTMASLVAALSPADITRYYPVVDPLATPTDLHRHEVSAVVEAVNPLIANAFALYLKTKNYHWHASGAHFRDYHLLFDEQAEGILESVDVLAERVRKLGGTTISSGSCSCWALPARSSPAIWRCSWPVPIGMRAHGTRPGFTFCASSV
jgi:hypothetical protein